MKIARSIGIMMVSTVAFILVFGTVQAQEKQLTEIAKGVICRDVVEREAVEAGDSFPSSVEKLYCFTDVRTEAAPTEITHVWFFGEEERAKVKLAVNGSRWRTKSSKRIRPTEIGSWRVDILDATGQKILTVPFDITE